MSRSHTTNLPPEQRQRLHPDFLANEQAYWQLRDSLLPAYRGQWVAIQDGKVIGAAPNVLAVTDTAVSAGGHPYIALVGAEDDVVFRVRTVVFAYGRVNVPEELAPALPRRA